ncbi:hypothetical protein [Thermoflexus hugenholtzii]
MAVPGETTRITLLVAQALERLGIPYAIGGALASSLHGVMRSTLDVDIVADIRLEHIPALIDALSDVLSVWKVRAGELDLDYMRRWANELGMADLLERALREAEIQ